MTAVDRLETTGRAALPPLPSAARRATCRSIQPGGAVLRPTAETRALPVDQRARDVARTGSGRYFRDVTVAGVHLRVLTTADADGGAVQVARPLTEVDHALSRLRFVLIVVGLAGIALAALLGGLVARAALAPVARFTRRTEALTADPDPSERLEVKGKDELARLAQSFNATLDALERSVQAQRSLVADASHELRTPIASLRANIQTLEDADRLPEHEREEAARGHHRGARRAHRTRRRRGRARARRRAPRHCRRRRARPDRRSRAREGGAALARPALQRRARAHARVRLARADRSSGREPARQRRQVEPARRRDRGHARATPC